MKLYSKHGEEFIINIFLTLLGYSRLKYIELTLDKSQDTLEKCIINSFKYYGGVPEEIIFDHMKTVVDHSSLIYLFNDSLTGLSVGVPARHIRNLRNNSEMEM